MDVTVTDAPDQKRYEARVDGELAAFVDYIPTGELIAFTHTEVLPAFEGKGIGAQLVKGALEDVRGSRRSVLAVCPFVSGYLQRHPGEYGDLVYRSRTGAVRD